MIRYISIRLPGPICKCDTQDLGWGFEIIGGKRIALVVFCKSCDAKVVTGNKVGARFDLETPYPADRQKKAGQKRSGDPESDRRKRRLLDRLGGKKPETDGNVISFPDPKKDG